MSKKQQTGSKGKQGGGKQHAVTMGSVTENIANSEAGRARKRAENKARQAANAKRREDAIEKMRTQALEEEARLRAKQITDRVNIALDCEKIFAGVEGHYNLFGLSVNIHPHPTAPSSIMVLELVNALPETGILDVARPGTYIPIHALRMNPHRVEWRHQDVQAIAKHFHANAFGSIAIELRRQHFVEQSAERKAQERKQTPTQTAVKQTVEKEVTHSFNERLLTARGLWMMSDGVIIATWDNPRGAHCAGVRSAPKGHALAGYTLFIKTAHLGLEENGMQGHELREYLREHLAEISETAVA
ncbi:hypothetical protein A3C87_03555 [Candidatus Kaiserbacteria bacterium RIFCSPHIGHO2_02_FULL_49_34]|uniref:Uncharacterized protein n=1 Tax=Candidatus Kaiserbacteria bacterium RIFCSPHIGHO2_02_FULL_49_34 TaxID=1798491 RepID=A0A1F6DIF3_9BACT|nr:MAG: hypothetical protein A3C87_03555 [Candidatus Kaiserbacteria bacterium RIFCSPHIGHO2_02_FULL_49_34]